MLNPELKNNNLGKSPNLKIRAFDFSRELIRLCQDLPEKKLFWIIQDQLLRAGTSIGANLIEAKASSSRKDFIKFYQISLKSANETEYWLLLLKEADNNLNGKVDHFLSELEEIGKMLGRSLLTLKNKI